MASESGDFRASPTHMDIMKQKVLASIQNHKFAFLLSSLALLMLLFPFLENETIGQHVFTILLGLILISGIIVVSDTRSMFFIIVGISVITIVLNVVRYLDPNPVWHYGYQIFAIVFFLFTAFVLFRHILNKKRVTHDEVFGAISIYLLIALAFASLFILAERIEPGSFVKNLNTTSQGMTYSDYIYYSFGSITTAGTGEIVEIGSFVRALTMIESVIGIFYVAFVISKLVSPLNK
jgi:hypothetical protein